MRVVRLIRALSVLIGTLILLTEAYLFFVYPVTKPPLSNMLSSSEQAMAGLGQFVSGTITLYNMLHICQAFGSLGCNDIYFMLLVFGVVGLFALWLIFHK